MERTLRILIVVLLSIGIATGVAWFYPFLFHWSTNYWLAGGIVMGAGTLHGGLTGMTNKYCNNPLGKNEFKITLLFFLLFYYLQWAFTTGSSPLHPGDVLQGWIHRADEVNYVVSNEHDVVGHSISPLMMRIYQVLEFFGLLGFFSWSFVMTRRKDEKE